MPKIMSNHIIYNFKKVGAENERIFMFYIPNVPLPPHAKQVLCHDLPNAVTSSALYTLFSHLGHLVFFIAPNKAAGGSGNVVAAGWVHLGGGDVILDFISASILDFWTLSAIGLLTGVSPVFSDETIACFCFNIATTGETEGDAVGDRGSPPPSATTLIWVCFIFNIATIELEPPMLPCLFFIGENTVAPADEDAAVVDGVDASAAAALTSALSRDILKKYCGEFIKIYRSRKVSLIMI